MEPIKISEIKSISDYELERSGLRPRIMALKDRRRLRAGENMTFLFENRATVLYQIQEMMRIERIVKLEDIAHEADTYNELIPGPNELSASFLIEYETPELRSVWLKELLGLEDHVWLDIGSTPPVPGSFDTRQISTDRLSSVQYVKFKLSPEQAAQFPTGATLRIDHPKYRAETRLTPEQLAELAQDLR